MTNPNMFVIKTSFAFCDRQRAQHSREIVVLPLTPGSLTRPDAIRFLQRATFGARPGDEAELIDMGVDAWLEDQFARTPSETNDDRRYGDSKLSRSYWKGVLDDDDQLRRRVAYALSQILVASSTDLGGDEISAYADLLEANAFSTYRDLLDRISRSAPMGDYLTYIGNKKADESTGSVPDENYAREILQLFSIGLWELDPDGSRKQNGVDADGNPVNTPTYDNDDVTGLARVFTGWLHGSDDENVPMYLRDSRHESGTKVFLGITIPENTSGEDSLQIALDRITNHPNVAPFISKQLIQRLVTSNPSPGYVERIASVFDDDGTGQRGNLAAVVRAILIDDEGWRADQPESFGKLREPVLRFTTVMRALGVGSKKKKWSYRGLDNPADELGQQPYVSPSVFNFYRPGYVPPRTAFSDGGLVAPEFQIANEVSVIGWVNFLAEELRRSSRTRTFDIDDLEDIIHRADDDELTDKVDQLVTEVVARLCPNGITDELRAIVQSAVEDTTRGRSNDETRERIACAVLLIAASTDFLYER